MSGQWSGSTRRTRLPADWNRRRERMLRRDGYRCTALDDYGIRCEEPATDVDHIEPGDNHDETNLAALCAWHHAKKSAREGGRAARTHRAPRQRPPEQHPGELLLLQDPDSTSITQRDGTPGG